MPALTRPKSWLPLEVPPPFEASGAFETCRVKKGKILHWADHLDRLKASLKTLGISMADSGWTDSLTRRLKTAAQRVGEGFVRIAVRRSGVNGDRWLIHEHRGIPYERQQRARGVSLVTVATCGSGAASTGLQAKASERLGNILARMEGGRAFEVLRLGPHGYLTEGTVSNLFLVKRGTLITPPSWLGVLEGVTRGLVLKYASHIHMEHSQVPVTRHDLFNADEAFLTNVLMGILPIREVDGRRIGIRVPGPITRKLWKAVEEKG
jgi:branched-chain amino acid aminotransferase